MRYSGPKGMNDVLPAESYRWQFVEEKFRQFCALYGYQEIRTPILEPTDLFARGLGDTTDIVTKEMYTLTTKGGDSLALKPEGTAPVVRAYIERHLAVPGSVTKLYYITPIYRYERPQAGRYREGHQLGLEAIGSNDPMADAEIIALTMNFYAKLGIKDTELRLNSVGTVESRAGYQQALLEFARPFFQKFPEDYVARLEKNPMRLLDSKDPEIQAIMTDAPDIFDYLDDESRQHFEKVTDYLKALNIPYVRDRFLVRGLDYYTKTAFEVVSGKLGAQNSLCGGGRYDELIEECGGDSTPAVGVAMGIERALIVMEAQGIAIPDEFKPVVYVVTIGNVRLEAMKLLEELRRQNIPADIELSERSLKAQMRQANKSEARFALIMGEDELGRGVVGLKDLQTNIQEEIPLDQIVERILTSL